MYEHNALGYWSGLVLCLTKVTSSRARCPATALIGCYDILILGKSPIKWRQRHDMTLAVDWDVKHQFKQKNFKHTMITI